MDAIVTVSDRFDLEAVEKAVEIAHFDVEPSKTHAWSFVVKGISEEELEQLRDIVGPEGKVTRSVFGSYDLWD